MSDLFSTLQTSAYLKRRFPEDLRRINQLNTSTLFSGWSLINKKYFVLLVCK